MKLILGSSSIYRKKLLARLRIDFECDSPNIDEPIEASLTPKANAKKLAFLKAQAVAKKHEQAIIIASDQICCVNDTILGKPDNYSKAFAQLKLSSRQKVQFYTAVCVYDSRAAEFYEFIDTTDVYFKNLQDNEIKKYLEIEQPFDCAGSFKAESLGVCLFEKIESQDPTALIGLPLIELSGVLKKVGINPLGEKIE